MSTGPLHLLLECQIRSIIFKILYIEGSVAWLLSSGKVTTYERISSLFVSYLFFPFIAIFACLKEFIHCEVLLRGHFYFQGHWLFIIRLGKVPMGPSS